MVDLIAEHRSTLVFANSRRLAERLTARLNEIWVERLADAGDAEGVRLPDPGSLAPAQIMAQSGASAGAPPVLARAHHGSVSKEQRAIIEGELKAGRLPCRGRHQQPRARHRHGRGRSRRPGRVAAHRGQRAAAGRPRRSPGRRGLARGAVPQAPRRPGPRPASSHSGCRSGAIELIRRSRATRSTCWPSRSSPWSRWIPGPWTTSRRWSAGRLRSRA